MQGGNNSIRRTGNEESSSSFSKNADSLDAVASLAFALSMRIGGRGSAWEYAPHAKKKSLNHPVLANYVGGPKIIQELDIHSNVPVTSPSSGCSVDFSCTPSVSVADEELPRTAYTLGSRLRRYESTEQ